MEIKTGVTVRLRCGAGRALRQMGFHNLVRSSDYWELYLQKEKKSVFPAINEELPLGGLTIFL